MAWNFSHWTHIGSNGLIPIYHLKSLDLRFIFGKSYSQTDIYGDHLITEVFYPLKRKCFSLFCRFLFEHLKKKHILYLRELFDLQLG